MNRFKSNQKLLFKAETVFNLSSKFNLIGSLKIK